MRADPLFDRLQEVVIGVQRILREQDGAMTPAQHALMARLVRNGPSTVGALAEAENVSAATISRMLDTLEQKNLVRRARDKRDRRVVYAVATREGTAHIKHPGACPLSARLRQLGELERENIVAALDALEHLIES